MLGVVLCAYLASPLSGRARDDYRIAGWLMLVGVGLWGLTWYLNTYVFKKKVEFDPSHIDSSGPVN
jgi:APA family basic amino acid/polyamine antiporter